MASKAAVAPVLESQGNARAAFRNPRNQPLIALKIWALERRGMVPDIGGDLRRKIAKAAVEVFNEANDTDLDLMIGAARGENDEGAELFAQSIADKVGGTWLDLLLQLIPLLLPLITCL